MQFGAPLSWLPRTGLITFADPITELVLLVQTADVPMCGRWPTTLTTVPAPFDLTPSRGGWRGLPAADMCCVA